MQFYPKVVQLAAIALSIAGLTSLASTSPSDLRLKTLDGRPPLIIAHRGLPGLFPEEVLAGYEAAIASGADALELDLQSSRDGVLFACHNVYLSDTTDIDRHPEFAMRKKLRTVDGVLTGPDWYISDFSAAELKTLRVKQPLKSRSKQYDGLFPMATFQEIIDLTKQALAAKPGRRVSVYPETKNPLYQRDLGLPLEETLVATLTAAGWNSPDAPVFVQSFDPASLKTLRRLGLKTKVVQLIGASGFDYQTGALFYNAPDTARPYSWVRSRDTRTYAAMVTLQGLAEIKTYAQGIGPWKPYVMGLRATGQDGEAATAWNQISETGPTSLIGDAHRLGLFVHPYTFRDEPEFLTKTNHEDPYAEYATYFAMGADGVFTDFSTTARWSLTQWLREKARQGD